MESLTTFLQQATDYQNVGLFLLRLVIGFQFTYSGVTKIRKVKGFSEGIGLPPAVGLLVILAELTGGVGLLLGVLTQVAALFIMIVMVGSIGFKVIKWKSPYWANKGGWEYDLIWFSIAFLMLVTAGGSISIYPTF